MRIEGTGKTGKGRKETVKLYMLYKAEPGEGESENDTANAKHIQQQKHKAQNIKHKAQSTNRTLPKQCEANRSAASKQTESTKERKEFFSLEIGDRTEPEEALGARGLRLRLRFRSRDLRFDSVRFDSVRFGEASERHYAPPVDYALSGTGGECELCARGRKAKGWGGARSWSVRSRRKGEGKQREGKEIKERKGNAQHKETHAPIRNPSVSRRRNGRRDVALFVWKRKTKKELVDNFSSSVSSTSQTNKQNNPPAQSSHQAPYPLPVFGRFGPE